MNTEISQEIFLKIREHINVLLITVVSSEHEPVRKRLRPIPGFLRNFEKYEIGFFGSFLCMHVRISESDKEGERQGGIVVAQEIHKAVELLRPRDKPSTLVCVMPGIAAGCRRNTSDGTKSYISDIVHHFCEENFPLDTRTSILDRIDALPEISIEVKNFVRNTLIPIIDEFNIEKTGKDRKQLDEYIVILKKIEENLNLNSCQMIIPTELTPEANAEGENICDILLASSITDCELKKIKPTHEELKSTGRKSFELVARWNDKINEWKFNVQGNPCKVHIGDLFSGGSLIRSFSYRNMLLQLAKNEKINLIGAEMEGHGLSKTTDAISQDDTARFVSFLFAKSICDWGVAKTDLYHDYAAEASADFLEFLMTFKDRFRPFITGTSENDIIKIISLNQRRKEETALDVCFLETKPSMIFNRQSKRIEDQYRHKSWIDKEV